MKNILIILFFITVFIFAGEPIKPITLHLKYNYQKAKLGYMLLWIQISPQMAKYPVQLVMT